MNNINEIKCEVCPYKNETNEKYNTSVIPIKMTFIAGGGRPGAETRVNKIICGHCNQEIDITDLYCRRCGFAFLWNEFSK